MDNQERAAWLAGRKQGIGGSDAAILFDCNPWQSAYHLYQDKVGAIEDDEDTPAAFWGRKLEGTVREAYCEILGRQVVDGVTNAVHPELSFMLANTDGKVLEVPDQDGDGVYEGKTTTVFNARNWETDVPLYYQVQVQHYLSVLDLQWGSVACLIMGQRDPFVWKDVERNDRFIEALQEREHHFWHRHVLARVPPPVDGSLSTERALKLLHPKDSGRLIMLPAQVQEWWTERQAIKSKMKDLEATERELGNKLRDALGDASYGMFDDGEGVSCKHQFGGASPTSVLDAVEQLHGEGERERVAAIAQEHRPEFRSLRKAGKRTLARIKREQDEEPPALGAGEE